MKRTIVIVLLAAILAAVVAPAVMAAPQTAPAEARGYSCYVVAGTAYVRRAGSAALAYVAKSYVGYRSWAGRVGAFYVSVTYRGVIWGFHRWSCTVW